MRGELPVESLRGIHPSGSIWRSPHSQENHWNFSGCQFCLFRGKLSLMVFAVPENLGICSLLAASTALVHLKMKNDLKSELQLPVEVCGAGSEQGVTALRSAWTPLSTWAFPNHQFWLHNLPRVEASLQISPSYGELNREEGRERGVERLNKSEPFTKRAEN